MPTSTYVALANVTLGSSASSVTFSSIPATYRDLVLVYNGVNGNSNAGLRVRINSDTGSNYNGLEMIGTSGGASSGNTSNAANIDIFFGHADATIGIADFMDYSATDKHKTILVRTGVTNLFVAARTLRWASTSAITSIQIYRHDTTISAGARLDLYGIAS